MPLGAWVPNEPEAPRPDPSDEAFRRALAALDQPVIVVDDGGRAAVATGGRASLGAEALGDASPLLGYVPPLSPGDLGDPAFRAAYGVDAAYVAGEMANGIASEELVIAVAQAGLLGVFGAAGLTVPRVEAAIARLEEALPGGRWGVNLIHSPDDPALESALVDLFLARGVGFVSASAYLELTLPVVRYRLAGIHRDASGAIVVPHRLMAKVSRVEVATRFLSPAPERFVRELQASGALTSEQAELAALVPMVDDLTAEADSGGHTDNRPLVLLLPALLKLRDQLARQHGYAARVRVGAAGGIATPSSVASAFSMGAAYVVTGSINQATLEAGTSDRVRQLLKDAAATDVAMAPAADMFEMGVKVQVLTRGTLFAVRSSRLYEIYRAFDGIAALPPAVREELETKFFRSTLEAAWGECEAFFRARDPGQLERAAREPRHKLALLCRSYLGQASKWANAGVPDRALDYQIWCGPSMGAFNEWVRGSVLEPWESRRAVLIAKNLLVGAATLTRATALATQLGSLPAGIADFAPLPEAALPPLSRPRDASPAKAEARPGARAPKGEPIAIVGMGAMFPEADGLLAFWRLLRTGKDAVGDVPDTHWSVADYYDPDPRAPDKTYAKRGAFLRPHDFDPTEFGIPPSILEATDTSQLLGLVVARRAMEDAGYGEGRAWNRSRASVILGVTGTQELVIELGARLGHPRWKKALREAGVDEETARDVVARIGQSYVGWQESSFPGLLGNVVAGRIANRLDLGGTNCVLDAACASSLAAVHLAVLELRAGTSDVVLTGGVDCLNDIFMHMCFSKTPALSASGDVRPFSDKADGTLLGEGLGMVVLKRLSDAVRDGDRVYAEILGVGTASDGRAKSVYAPLPAGQARALRAAYDASGVRPREVSLLEAHGTGTKAGDLAELEALRAVYREDSGDAAWCALGTVKSQLGHTKAAAGAAGMMKAALALHHKVLLPTLKVERPHPSMELATSPFALTGVAQPWVGDGEHPRRAAVSSFGFGGSNFHVVLGEHEAQRREPAWDGSVEMLALSADDPETLVASARGFLGAEKSARGAALARSRETFDTRKRHRLVAVFGFEADVVAALEPALERIRARPGEAFHLPAKGAALVSYGAGAAPGGLAFLFPGQGAQHVGMLRELSCIFPELLEALQTHPPLARAIHPLPSFDEEVTREREVHLTRTENAQPALGLVGRGLFALLTRRFKLAPSVVAGHSYGELLALHAAGVLSAEGLDEASRARGASMAVNGGDHGTMLAVLAPLTEVERFVEEEGLALVLANRNGPRQGVLSGARAEIERATALASARGMRTAPLAVSAAFHSPLVAGASSRFRALMDDVSWSSPSIPVVADATAEPYPDDEKQGKDLLASQIARPVRWDEVVARLYAMGARSFVEVGPRTALTGMVRANLGDRRFSALSVDAGSSHGGLFDLASVLASVAAEGHPVALGAWEPRNASHAARVPKMAVRLGGANYRAPVEPLPPRQPRPAPGKPPAELPLAMPRTEAAAVVSHSARIDEGIRSLQAMQEQTARVHQLFLEGQRAAHQSLQALLTGALMPSPAREPAIPRTAPVVAPPPSYEPPVTFAPERPKELDVASLLLSVVAEATGYPVETLRLEMGMEADLGIDSIKRVEILSMLSKRVPGAPHVNPEKLGSLRTLQDVADFLGKSSSRAAPARPAAAPVDEPNGDAVDAKGALLGVVAELTGYPLETLRVEMDMEADLGIDSIKRVEILSMLSKRIPGAPSVNPERLAKLRTLAQVLEFVSAGADAAQPATEGSPPKEPAPRPLQGLARRTLVATPAPLLGGHGSFELPSGDVLVTSGAPALAEALRDAFVASGRSARVVRPGDDLGQGAVAALFLLAPEDAWTAATEAHLAWALGVTRSLAPRLREARGLVSAVSRRDGAFGHATRAPTWSPLSGALAGLAKTVAHEWPEATSRVIDVSSMWSVEAAARAIVEEIAAHGPREVGLGPAGRVTLALRSDDVLPLPSRIDRGAVLVVTGGARGVTAACAKELAVRTGASLLLLGRSPQPTKEPAWLAHARTEAEIKRAWLENAPAGERPSPRVLGEACDAVLAAREIRETMSELSSLGVRAVYRAADARDERAVEAALAVARSTLGPIQGIVHGAGVVRDKRLEDKRDEDFEQVLSPKLRGLRTLLEATSGDDLRCLALFASASGRFGRRGQSDYAVANQALVSIAEDEARRRPLCRVVAIDWGPWEGGMVTPSLRREFEREGVPLISLKEGARALCDEVLSLPGGPSEVVLGAGFGSEAPGGWALGALYRLDASFPVLRDHRLAGKAVLPLAMTLEWFAAAAIKVAGLPLVSLEDVRVFRGVTVGSEPEDVTVWVGPREPEADQRFVVELRTGDQVHVRALAVVGSERSEARPLTVPEPLHAPRLTMQRVYAEQLFHGPSLEAIGAIEGIGESGMVAVLATHPTSERLLPGPPIPWTLDPLVLDGVFQAMIVWCRAHLGAPSLPSRIASLKVHGSFGATRTVRAILRIVSVEGMVVSADVDLTDREGRSLARLLGFRCTASASLSRAFVTEPPPALTTA